MSGYAEGYEYLISQNNFDEKWPTQENKGEEVLAPGGKPKVPDTYSCHIRTDTTYDQKKPFSVFCFGSTLNRETKENDIISLFSEQCVDSKLIIDGPSLSNIGFLGLTVEKNTENAVKEILEWLKTAEENDSGEYVVNISGFSRGAVTALWIANRVALLNDVNNYSIPLDALQKIIETNGLKEKLQKVRFRIFAIDPVAGLGDKGKMPGCVIPKNVKEYMGILQMDERRDGFKPQDLTRVKIEDPMTTKVSFLPLPGRHSASTVIDAHWALPLERKVGGVVRSLLNAFFRNSGTDFKKELSPELKKKLKHEVAEKKSLHREVIEYLTKNVNLSDEELKLSLRKELDDRFSEESEPSFMENLWESLESEFNKESKEENLNEILESYQILHGGKEKYLREARLCYSDAKFSGPPAKFSDRKFNENLEDYVSDSRFFMNQHERELFKLIYPNLFNFIFEHAVGTERTGKEEIKRLIGEEFSSIKTKNPKLFNRLVKEGFFDKKKQKLIGPQGNYRIEDCRLVRSLYSNHSLVKKLPRISEHSDRLYQLEQEVREVADYHQRHKDTNPAINEVTPYSPYKAEAIRIKKDMRNILKEKITDAEKHEDILNMLKKEYHLLINYNEEDPLAINLKIILKRHKRDVMPVKRARNIFFLIYLLGSLTLSTALLILKNSPPSFVADILFEANVALVLASIFWAAANFSKAFLSKRKILLSSFLPLGLSLVVILVGLLYCALICFLPVNSILEVLSYTMAGLMVLGASRSKSLYPNKIHEKNNKNEESDLAQKKPSRLLTFLYMLSAAVLASGSATLLTLGTGILWLQIAAPIAVFTMPFLFMAAIMLSKWSAKTKQRLLIFEKALLGLTTVAALVFFFAAELLELQALSIVSSTSFVLDETLKSIAYIAVPSLVGVLSIVSVLLRIPTLTQIYRKLEEDLHSKIDGFKTSSLAAAVSGGQFSEDPRRQVKKRFLGKYEDSECLIKSVDVARGP